jgi:hypothetical protein
VVHRCGGGARCTSRPSTARGGNLRWPSRYGRDFVEERRTTFFAPTVCLCLHLDIWTLSVVPLLTFHTWYVAIYKSRRTQRPNQSSRGRPNYTSKISDPPALIGPGLTVRCAHQGVRTQFSSPSLFSRPQLNPPSHPVRTSYFFRPPAWGFP